MKPEQPVGTLRHRLAYGATMLVVCGLSLLLLIYVGFGEAQRTYPNFHFEKLAAQGRIVQNAMDSHLRAGLPPGQFVGFAGMAKDIKESDPSIAQIALFDTAGQVLMAVGDAKVGLLADDRNGAAPSGPTRYEQASDSTYYQVALPLRSKFETVGWIAVSVPRATIAARLHHSIMLPLIAVGGLSLLFAVFATLSAPSLASRRVPWLQIGYLVTFAGMAALVLMQLMALYAEGAQEKSRALAASLGQRLGDIFEYNLALGSLDGLDRVFSDYRRLNPEISAAGMTVDGMVRFHTSGQAIGKPWSTQPGTYEFASDISPAGHPQRVTVTVALPGDVVTQQVARSAKNFAALFVATGFLASLFLQLAGAVHHMRARESGTAARERDRLDVVRPVFFVAMFVEHMTYSFLPQFVHHAADQAGLPASLVSSPFLLYYASFALTLIPAGYLSRRWGARTLIYTGLVLSACGVMALALPAGFWPLVLGRAMSGIGQGMLFIGVQNYVLSVSSPERRTQGAAIIVFGFQGGMIAGTAIGSLLVTYTGSIPVFLLAGVLGLASALYTVLLVPPIPAGAGAEADVPGIATAIRRLARDVRAVGADGGFLRTMLLIGVPAKAVLTGVVVFALPLILARRGYPQDDIGQVIMLYAIGVLVASSYASRVVDRTGRSAWALVLGAAASGVGLLLVGLAPAVAYSAVALIAGVVLVGLAHGCINAPIVTHVAELEVSSRIGVEAVTTTYRFLERVGHALGPVLVAQLLLFNGQDTRAVAWLGAAVVALGLLFAVRIDPGPTRLERGASA